MLPPATGPRSNGKPASIQAIFKALKHFLVDSVILVAEDEILSVYR